MHDTTLPNAYNSPTFGRLDWDATLKKIVWFLGRDTKASYEIIIGTDSQGQNGDVDFVSAIIVHKKGRGGIYLRRGFFIFSGLPVNSVQLMTPSFLFPGRRAGGRAGRSSR